MGKTIIIREGAAGLSAYQIALRNGLSPNVTEAQWIAAIGGGGAAGPNSTRIKRETFAFAGAGPYALAQAPDGDFTMLLLDGTEQANDPFAINSQGLTLVGTPAGYLTVSLIYTY